MVIRAHLPGGLPFAVIAISLGVLRSTFFFPFLLIRLRSRELRTNLSRIISPAINVILPDKDKE